MEALFLDGRERQQSAKRLLIGCHDKGQAGWKGPAIQLKWHYLHTNSPSNRR